jgi:hypothetical protein
LSFVTRSGGGYFLWQGHSVALSDDGNTAIVGSPLDDSLSNEHFSGAAWVFERGDGSWTEQRKLFSEEVIGHAQQGFSVALSADGKTAIIGSPGDDDRNGAAWVFERGDGSWTEQQKLTGRAAIGRAQQGVSVALSGDGNTAIVGGLGDDDEKGAAWVFERGDGSWTEQQKLTGRAVIGRAQQGVSVALSGDGNTAIVGGPGDDDEKGAAWVFTRSSGTWTHLQKLVGREAIGPARQGSSVALSTDGDTAIVGGTNDDGGKGAAWVYSVSIGQPGCLRIVPINFGVQVAVVGKLCGTSVFPDVVFENRITIQPLDSICWSVRGLSCPNCQSRRCPDYDIVFGLVALRGSPTTSAFAPLLGNKRTSDAPLPSFLIYEYTA